jgi:carbamoyl-phosphate synthase large subunit
MNVQFAVKNEDIYILEVNPRGSRTIPFVGKATGVPLAKIAAKLMVGKTLKELGLTQEKRISHIAVKEAVFPFDRFYGVDTILGPEMKSTGEVMGIDDDFGLAFGKSQTACGIRFSFRKIFISLKDKDKPVSSNRKQPLNSTFGHCNQGDRKVSEGARNSDQQGNRRRFHYRGPDKNKEPFYH